MKPDEPSLGLLAGALGAPPLRVQRSAAAGRWSGPIAEAAVLAVPPALPHRQARLQVLRRVIDLQADGRYALQIHAAEHADLLGPLNRVPQRMFDLQGCLSTWPHAVLLRRLFLWVDGRRVDERLRSCFPGAAGDLTLDPLPSPPRRLDAALAAITPPADAAAALRQAIRLLRQLLACRPQRHRQAFPSLLVLGGAPGVAMPSTARVGDPRAPDGLFHEAVWMPGASSSGSSAHGPAPPPGHDAGAPRNDPQARSTLVDQHHPPAAQAPGLPRAPASGHRVAQHDEWDYRQRRYRRRWVSVHERDVRGTDLNYRANLLVRYPSLQHQISRRFARIGADAPRRQRRLLDGEGIDLEAALEAFVERRSGRLPAHDRLYQDRPRQQRELCLALLLDTSGSTGYDIPDNSHPAPAVADSWDHDDLLWQMAADRATSPARPRRQVIDVIKDAAALLCEATHSLGDRQAVFAFSGEGREQVEFAVVKRFDQDWSTQSAADLASLQPTGSTRTGAAVRHALQHLRAEAARRKILIVISDGYPQDRDYGPDPDDLQYGLLDTARALGEAERAGVSVLNISVDAAANDYLRRICPKYRYWVVDEADELPFKMLELHRLMRGHSC